MTCPPPAGSRQASNNNINIKMISTSEIKISCIIDRADADKAVSAIHDMLFD